MEIPQQASRDHFALWVFDSGTGPVAYLDSAPNSRRVPFDDWWGRVVIRCAAGEFTRNGLVLAVTNKSGGAHVDPEIDEVFENLQSGAGLWLKVDDGVGPMPLENAAFIAIRQIAHEILKTFKPGYEKARALDGRCSFGSFVFTITNEDGNVEILCEPPTLNVSSAGAIRARQSCACESGLLFMDCHGKLSTSRAQDGSSSHAGQVTTPQ